MPSSNYRLTEDRFAAIKAERAAEAAAKRQARLDLAVPGNYANMIGYSDVTPFEILKRTAKTITIREMAARRSEDWTPKFTLGGFASHCTNNDDQSWDIVPNPSAPEVVAYLRKDGFFHSHFGRHAPSSTPRKKYDYNF